MRENPYITILEFLMLAIHLLKRFALTVVDF